MYFFPHTGQIQRVHRHHVRNRQHKKECLWHLAFRVSYSFVETLRVSQSRGHGAPAEGKSGAHFGLPQKS